MREILTSDDAAEYLRIHKKTACRLAREGKIPARKLGGNWRFLRADLTNWLRNSNNATRDSDSVTAGRIG
jgi:excisionase family DNA binding protein